MLGATLLIFVQSAEVGTGPCTFGKCANRIVPTSALPDALAPAAEEAPVGL